MKTGRNIIFCNFHEKEKQWITINDIRDEKDCWEINECHRFPYIKFVDSLYELFRSNGFLAVIKSKDINYDVKTFDLKYHNKFKNFNYIAIVDEKYKETNKFDKYSKIGLINYDLFTLDYSSWDIDNLYKKHIEKTRNNKINIENELKIIQKLEQKETSSRELAKIINVSSRTIERYLLILSNNGYSIRYNKQTKKWYLLK